MVSKLFDPPKSPDDLGDFEDAPCWFDPPKSLLIRGTLKTLPAGSIPLNPPMIWGTLKTLPALIKIKQESFVGWRLR